MRGSWHGRWDKKINSRAMYAWHYHDQHVFITRNTENQLLRHGVISTSLVAHTNTLKRNSRAIFSVL